MMCVRILKAAVAALVITGVSTTHAAPPESEFSRRVDELVRWISENSEYPSAMKQRPDFVFLPPQTIRTAFSRKGLGYSDQSSSVRAVQVKGAIYLPETFSLGRDDFMLLHELVHHLQDESEQKFDCLAEREREAYKLQSRFVAETGVGDSPNDMFMLMLRCDIR